MESVYQVIEINMAIVYFIYGLVYFVFGLAIVLQQRALSNFRLARYLWLLAAFGIIHGVMEWGSVFIPVQAAYLSKSWIDGLLTLQKIARSVSFAFLLQFAVIMIAPRVTWITRKKLLVNLYAPLWSFSVSLLGIFILQGHQGEHLIRYLLAFPAASLTAVAFLLERKSFVGLPSTKARFNLTMTSVAFMAYAVVGGLIVPSNTLPPPFSWLHYETVFSFTGFPIQIYRTVVGLAMSFFIIRTLSLFDVEVRHRVELTERRQALLEDRNRIARDLHDGVVQSIFAAGLQLEAANQSLAPGPDEVKPMIYRAKKQLNDVIADIRRYIFELDPTEAASGELVATLKRLLDDFSLSSATETSLTVDGDLTKISTQNQQDIILITKECLANVAKHSLASRVELRLGYQTDGLEYDFRDNGIGIEANRLTHPRKQGHGRGHDNIAARAASMGTELSISSGPDGKGTFVTMWIPYRESEKENHVPMAAESGS